MVLVKNLYTLVSVVAGVFRESKVYHGTGTNSVLSIYTSVLKRSEANKQVIITVSSW